MYTESPLKSIVDSESINFILKSINTKSGRVFIYNVYFLFFFINRKFIIII